MIGGVISILCMLVTGFAISKAVSKFKKDWPDAFKKHQKLFTLLTILLFFFGFSLCMMIGGVVNGVILSIRMMIVAFQYAAGIIIIGILSVLAARFLKR